MSKNCINFVPVGQKSFEFFVILAVRGFGLGISLTRRPFVYLCGIPIYMSKSINTNAVATKVYNSFGLSAMGVSSFAGWLAVAGSRSAGGRAVLASLKLKQGVEVTQKAVYNAIKKVYPFRNNEGKMCTASAVVGGVYSPAVVSVVSVAFIAAILDGGKVVNLPAFYIRKGGAVYSVASDYVNEGVNLAQKVRDLKEVRGTAEEDQRSAEVAHSRAVAGGASAIEIEMALKAVGVASSNCAVAVKNHENAVAEFDAWRDGLTAFVK